MKKLIKIFKNLLINYFNKIMKSYEYENKHGDDDFETVKEFEIKFGKHKGKKFKNLPYDYCDWIVSRKVLTTDVKEEYQKTNYLIQQYLTYRLIHETPPELLE